nr:hypothetical protein [Tanacetum cinerariifolium]
MHFRSKSCTRLNLRTLIKKTPVIGKKPILTNLRLNKSRPHHRRRRSQLEHAKRGLFKAMMLPDRLRGQLRKKLRWLKVRLPFLKTASMDASINLNTNAGYNDEDKVQEIRRTMGRDKAKAAGKNKGSKASRSSTMNDDALARLMVTEMTAQEKEQCEAFLEIKKKELMVTEMTAQEKEQCEAFLEIKKKEWNVINETLQLKSIDNNKKT